MSGTFLKWLPDPSNTSRRGAISPKPRRLARNRWLIGPKERTCSKHVHACGLFAAKLCRQPIMIICARHKTPTISPVDLSDALGNDAIAFRE
jgi:hypothetical protein